MAGSRFPDLWLDPEDDPRAEGPVMGDERTTLISYLRDYRLTFELKCSGLDAAQLATRSVEPSTLSLLGLLRHLAEVERSWFRRTLAGEDVDWIYRTEQDREAPFTGAVGDESVVEQAWADWRTEVAFAERFVDLAGSLDQTGHHHGTPIMLREVLVHLIEEYARHCGHADLLRERIDGRTGQ